MTDRLLEPILLGRNFLNWASFLMAIATFIMVLNAESKLGIVFFGILCGFNLGLFVESGSTHRYRSLTMDILEDYRKSVIKSLKEK